MNVKQSTRHKMRQKHLNNKETEGGAAKSTGDSVTFIKICTCTGPLKDRQGDRKRTKNNC